MVIEKKVAISTLSNGFIVCCSWTDENIYADDKQFAKSIPKVVKIIKAFYTPKDGNVLPF